MDRNKDRSRMEFIEQPNNRGGCHWVVRDRDGLVIGRYYDRAKARAILRGVRAKQQREDEERAEMLARNDNFVNALYGRR